MGRVGVEPTTMGLRVASESLRHCLRVNRSAAFAGECHLAGGARPGPMPGRPVPTLFPPSGFVGVCKWQGGHGSALDNAANEVRQACVDFDGCEHGGEQPSARLRTGTGSSREERCGSGGSLWPAAAVLTRGDRELKSTPSSSAGLVGHRRQRPLELRVRRGVVRRCAMHASKNHPITTVGEAAHKVSARHVRPGYTAEAARRPAPPCRSPLARTGLHSVARGTRALGVRRHIGSIISPIAKHHGRTRDTCARTPRPGGCGRIYRGAGRRCARLGSGQTHRADVRRRARSLHAGAPA